MNPLIRFKLPSIRTCICLLLAGGTMVVDAYATDRAFGTPRVHDELAGVGAVARAVDGTVFVLESLDHRVRYATPGAPGESVTWATFGEVADSSSPEALNFPQGIAVDAERNVFVADTGSNLVRLYRPDGAGGYRLDRNFGADGPPMSRPQDVEVASDGRIYALDAGNKRIMVAVGPGSRLWTEYRSDPDWAEPKGLGIGGDGTVYVADSGHHRIVKLSASGSTEYLGRYGSEDGSLRSPRDVAVGAENWLYVADSGNQRVAVLDHSGTLLHSLGQPPLPGRPSRLAVTAAGEVLLADPGTGWLITWPGPGGAQPQTAEQRGWDGYLRTATAHSGAEPWPPESARGEYSVRYSPDILVRQQPDISITTAAQEGLDHYASDPAVFGEPNWTWFQVNNSGSRPIPGGAISLWWDIDRSTTRFPDQWSRENVFEYWPADGEPRTGNFAQLGWIPAAAESHGRAIAGPLVWSVPMPAEAVDCDHEVALMARFLHIDDPMPFSNYGQQVWESNNIAIRYLPLVPRACIPFRDRYERNDRWATRLEVDEPWQHLHARCTEALTRHRLDMTYPDGLCPGIFEDGGPPDPDFGGRPAAAEEIWNMVVPDLSLHGPSDRDFFSIALPDLGDPAYGLDDIHPERIRILGERNPDFYEPQVMPECGTVQRQELGLASTDNTVNINISTVLLITAEATTGDENSTTDRPLDTSGETLYIYRDGSREETDGPSGILTRRIVCPQSREGLSMLDLSFGERFDGEGEYATREVPALGGYQLRLSYLTSIRRGTPTWADDFNDGRGIRNLGCIGSAMGLLPRGVFPFCGAAPGPGLIDLFQPHPQTPLLPGCIADGPGCLELSVFDWLRSDLPFELLFSSIGDLGIRLLNFEGQEIASAVPTSGSLDSIQVEQGKQGPLIQMLRVDDLASGTYFLEISGKPTRYTLQYRPPKAIDNQRPDQHGRAKGKEAR